MSSAAAREGMEPAQRTLRAGGGSPAQPVRQHRKTLILQTHSQHTVRAQPSAQARGVDTDLQADVLQRGIVAAGLGSH